MKQLTTSTNFLRLVLIILALGVLGIIFLLSPAFTNPANYELIPLVIGMYAAAIPFYLAVFQALKLLNSIDKNQAFSLTSVKSLRVIKHCAVAVSLIYIAISPYLYNLSQGEDAPGFMLFGTIAIGASLSLAVFIAVLQKLLQNAIDLKSENDLTV